MLVLGLVGGLAAGSRGYRWWGDVNDPVHQAQIGMLRNRGGDGEQGGSQTPPPVPPPAGPEVLAASFPSADGEGTADRGPARGGGDISLFSRGGLACDVMRGWF